MNDERTITAIKNRNEAAINEVITKYSKLLWAVAGAVLNNMDQLKMSRSVLPIHSFTYGNILTNTTPNEGS